MAKKKLKKKLDTSDDRTLDVFSDDIATIVKEAINAAFSDPRFHDTIRFGVSEGVTMFLELHFMRGKETTP